MNCDYFKSAVFYTQVKVNGEVASGTGPNKKVAKQNAAEAMLLQLGYKASTVSQNPTEVLLFLSGEVFWFCVFEQNVLLHLALIRDRLNLHTCNLSQNPFLISGRCCHSIPFLTHVVLTLYLHCTYTPFLIAPSFHIAPFKVPKVLLQISRVPVFSALITIPTSFLISTATPSQK